MMHGKRMRKMLVALALAALFIPVGAFAQPIELEMWSPYASPYTRPTVDKLVEMFNAQNPDIHLVESASTTTTTIPSPKRLARSATSIRETAT